MVLQTTGTRLLRLMMRAERSRLQDLGLDTEWLLFGPTDGQVVIESDTAVGNGPAEAWRMAAE
jgi:hypothetical protein